MKKIIVILLFTALFLEISPKNLIIGGDSLFASTYEELNMYEVKIENTLTKIITTMTVMAPDENQAKDNVYLNGWTVIGVKLLKERVKDTYNLNASSVATTIPKDIDLEGAIKIPEEKTKTLNKTKNNNTPKNDKNNIVISKEKGNEKVADNLNLLPDSKDLELIMTIHFKLGEVAPIFDDEISKLFDSLPKDKEYVLFGNADDVKIGKHATYGSNYELSYLRAEHIKKLLNEKGHNADRIRTVGLGTRYPLEKSGKKGSLKNRRVEIYGFRTQS